MWFAYYHRLRWYATLENKTPAETFPKCPSVLRVIDRSDRNPPITATSVTFWRSLRHASGLWLMDFDPTCRYRVRLTEILETFLRVFCFPKSRINENETLFIYIIFCVFVCLCPWPKHAKYIFFDWLHGIFYPVKLFLSLFTSVGWRSV